MYISESIGFKIKSVREYLHLSQKDLCEGICSQAYISLVEKGNKNISADILFKLSQRLGVNIHYFFEYYQSERDDYIQITMDNIRSEINKRNYQQVQTLITKEKNNPLFSSNKFVLQFIKWNEGICKFHLENDPDFAITLFDEALSMSDTTNKNYSEREIEILLSKAIIVAEEDLDESILIFEEILSGLSGILKLKDLQIPIRIYYNYSRILTKKGLYDKAIQLSKKGIVLNKTHDFSYLLGELFFQMALNYKKLHYCDLMKENYYLANQAFNIKGDKEAINILHKAFEHIEDGPLKLIEI
jgi:transcriptional regulator with XRE-family HTH domain